LIGQILQEVEWLNKACSLEVNELKRQHANLCKLVEERQQRRERIQQNATAAALGGEYEDHELQTLTKEQRSINHRSALSLCPSLYLSICHIPL
jgi:hypothetical protein